MEAAPHLSFERQPVHGRPRLGSILLRDGHLDEDQLSQALLEKERVGGRLGEFLLARGWVTARALAEALAEQHGIEFLDLGATNLDPTAYSLLPEKFARSLKALPVAFADDSTVVVAVADPTNIVASDDLRIALGLNVRLVCVASDALDQTIERVYRTHVGVDDELEVVEETADQEAVEQDSGAHTPAGKLVVALIARAVREGASDLHFEPTENGIAVRARVDGVMRHMTQVPKNMQAAVTGRLKVLAELDIAERRAPQDGRVTLRIAGEPMDLRLAVLPTTHGEQVVIRVMHRAAGALELDQLGMSAAAAAVFTRALRQPYGAVIACGPTGSGKTTTLYAALALLNSDERVLMTIEDPVEYQIAGVNQVEVNPKAGLSFARGLRTILRSDPDVLLVGEIRDEETARIAIQAAMTGHLVLSSLHTQNAPASIARLKDMGVEPSILASSLNCIVAQRLARRLCPECREAYPAGPDELEELGPTAAGATLYRPGGCVACAGTGYRGRVALYEVMPVQGRIRRLVEASTDEIFAAAIEDGMHTLRADGTRLCIEGVSSVEEIRRVTGDGLT